MEFGITTFAEAIPENEEGVALSHSVRIQHLMEEVKLADAIGLDVYGIGEHHRKDMAASAPEVILAGAATVTKQIRLTSATTIISSEDPVRVFQAFATGDALSNGRMEIMVGRGSFTESFPLFGYSLDDYDELFNEKLELLMKIREQEVMDWEGKHRPAIQNLGVYPRPVQESLPIWVGSVGTKESVLRAARLGLPISFAIIRTQKPADFAPLIKLYKEEGMKAGHDPKQLLVSAHFHGFIGRTDSEAVRKFFPSAQAMLNVFGKEKGRGTYSRQDFDKARSREGAMFVGSPETVADKIIHLKQHLDLDRFLLHLPLGPMPHEDIMKAIELYGKEVAPRVRKALFQQ